jgi:hypothetical protein
MHFTCFSQTHVLFKKLIFTEVPGTFYRFTTIPSVHTKHSGMKRCLAMSPMGVGAVRPARILASRRLSRPGKVRRRARGSPWSGLRVRLGAEVLPASPLGRATTRRPPEARFRRSHDEAGPRCSAGDSRGVYGRRLGG